MQQFCILRHHFYVTIYSKCCRCIKTIHKNLLTTCKIISASAKINSCYELERHIIANATEDVHSILLPT